jgi:hypothetical protein
MDVPLAQIDVNGKQNFWGAGEFAIVATRPKISHWALRINGFPARDVPTPEHPDQD